MLYVQEYENADVEPVPPKDQEEQLQWIQILKKCRSGVAAKTGFKCERGKVAAFQQAGQHCYDRIA